jgi:gliding motility-associated-like protein
MRYAQLFPLLVCFATAAAGQPVANFNATPQIGCPPMVVSFTDKSSGSPTSWSWTFTGGNPASSTAKNPTTSYATPGVYSVTLMVSNASGTSTKTMTNYITEQSPPTVSLSATPAALCPGMPITFTSSVTWNATGSGTYYWDFGDGSSSTSANPTHSYAIGGRSYTVKLTATNSTGCPTTYIANNLITAYGQPSVNFYAVDTAVCSIGGSATFISTTSGATPFNMNWDFGDGTSSSSASPVTHPYLAAGTYSVKLSVTDSRGCTDSLRRTNYIRVRSVTAVASVPGNVCEGTSLVVGSAAGTTSGATVSWDFGDGSARNFNDPATHLYTRAGTYTIRMFASVGGCTDTAVSTVTVNAKPNTAFSFTPQNPCPEPSAVTFTAAGGTSASCSWDFGDGFTGSGNPTTHTYNSALTDYPVKLIVTGTNGCVGYGYDTVHIYSGALTILDRPVEGCFPLIAKFHDTLWQPSVPSIWPYLPRYPFPAISRSWNFGDGGSAGNVARINHTYYNPGTYTCQLSVTTSNGCVFHDTLDVHVGGHSTVDFVAQPDSQCAGSPVQFTDISYSPYGPITAWFWDFGDRMSYALTQNPANIYVYSGIYTVTLVVSQNGCIDTLTRDSFMHILDPTSRPRYTVSCDTIGLVHFRDSSVNATYVKWYFGDGSTSMANNPNHQYAMPGTYIAALVAWNTTTGCHDSQAFVLRINNLTVDMSATDSTICFGDTIAFTPHIGGFIANASTSVAEIHWSWNQNVPPTILSVMMGHPDAFVPSLRGPLNIGVWVKDNNGCIVEKIRNNFIIVGGPVAAINAKPPAGCAPANILFTDTSTYAQGTTMASAYWDFGDGTNATTPFHSTGHFYPTVGSYGISLKVTDNIGCTDSIGVPNYMLISRPIASFATLGSTACEGTPYTFYNSSTGNNLTYLWSFGDGTTSTLTGPSHAYSTPGTYAVRLIAIDGVGCKDTMNLAAGVTVAQRPLAAFRMDDTINVCPPLTVNFTNTSSRGAVSYEWDFANGTSSTLSSPTATYVRPGIYNIRLIARSNKGCPDTAYGRVRLLGYNGVLSYSPLTGCAPLTVQFQANNVPGVSGFIYDFGDGHTTPTTATAVTHTYTTPGPHVPKLTMTDNLGCAAVSQGLDTVKVDGVIHGFTFTPFPGCDSGTIQFIDTSRGAYSQLNPVIWEFHDSTISTLASPVRHYPAPGHYKVIQYRSTTTGCRDTFVSEVVFYQRPVIQAGIDTLICAGDSIMFRPRGGVSYMWTPIASLSCGNCNNPFAFPNVPTTYVVVGTDTNGCSNNDTLNVDVKYKTVTQVVAVDEICSGDTVQFISAGASVYHWTPATGLSNADTSSPYVFPTETQHYELISRLAGCIPDTDFVNLVVHPTPTVDAGEGQTMIAGSTLHLQAIATGDIANWRWSPSEGIWSPSQPSTDASPKRSTVYTITATTEYGCFGTDTVRIVVLCDNSQVFMPNTFTPDGNGVNDIFYPRGKGLANIDHFRIYNRWGELVFERSNIAVDDKSNGWDGKKAGHELSPDVYVYTVEATCDTGEPIKWQGNVMLLR